MASQRTQVPTAVTCSSTPAALSSFPVLPHFPCDALPELSEMSPQVTRVLSGSHLPGARGPGRGRSVRSDVLPARVNCEPAKGGGVAV